jgi:V8-like Glu-specific endopeptidase
MLTALFSLNAYSGKDVIYGRDNRKDVYEVTDALQLKLAQSTAAMVRIAQFQRASKDNYFDIKGARTLEQGQNLCPSEKFSQQLIAPICSGFLVSPDTIVTAGHCYLSFDTPENVCKNFAWVFDYNMTSEKHDPTRDIHMSNIYLCKKVMAAKLDTSMDFAIIKLDRPVVGRTPVAYRNSGKIAPSTTLVVIGHPTGLPTKITTSGRITNNEQPTTFSTTLDTFHGNSGSAVFNSRNGVVEGILIQGKNDYILSKKDDPKSCFIVNKCDNDGYNCTAGDQSGPVQWGEVVLRITNIAPIIDRAINTVVR